MSLYYFAYGSNMSVARLQQRTPSAIPVGICSLAGHQLRFHKRGRDGSAKCDAYATGGQKDLTWGRLYTLDVAEKPLLDQVEGLGYGYEQKIIELELDGRQIDACTYVATDVDDGLQPFHWYKHHVLVGAREAGLADEYLTMIENVESVPDDDRRRTEQEMSIHV